MKRILRQLYQQFQHTLSDMVLHRKYYGNLLSLTDSIDKDVKKCREKNIRNQFDPLIKNFVISAKLKNRTGTGDKFAICLTNQQSRYKPYKCVCHAVI